MSETNRTDAGTREPRRRASPATSIAMLLIGALTWSFLHNLANLPLVVELLIALVVGCAVGFLAQEIVAHRRRR